MNSTKPCPLFSPSGEARVQPPHARLRLRHSGRCATWCNRAPASPTLRSPTLTHRPLHLASLSQRAQHAHSAQRTQRHSSAHAASPSLSVPESAANAAKDNAAEDGDTVEVAPQVLAGKSVAVVGGGPAGMLCAAHLARLGAAVDVFENRDPEAADKGAVPPAVWSIVLSSKAGHAIDAAGLNPDFGPKWRFEGSAIHMPDSPAMFFGDWAKPTGEASGAPALDMVVLATQRGIVAHLQAECGRVYGDSVRVHYGMRAVGGDVCAGEVMLEDAAGERVTRAFDVVIGADGARSSVRKLMQEQDSGLEVHTTDSSMGLVCTNVTSPGHPSTYSTLETTSGTPFRTLPEGFDGPLEGCAVNFFRPVKSGSPRVGSAVVAYRHSGAEVSFALTADAAWLRGQVADSDEAEIAAFLADAYPQLPRMWLEEVAAFLHSKAADESLRVRQPSFVTCNKLASGRAILIGDAAHSVSPNLGLGCDAALRDSELLSRACIAAAGDVEATALEFNAQRLESAQVLTHVSRRVDGGMNFKYHGDVASWILGLPYIVPQMANAAARKMPVLGFVKPHFFSAEAMLRGSDDWSNIKGEIHAYTAKLIAFCTAVVAVVSAVVWKGISMAAV